MTKNNLGKIKYLKDILVKFYLPLFIFGKISQSWHLDWATSARSRYNLLFDYFNCNL